MNTEPFFTVEDAQPLPPLGTCSTCGVSEDPMIAIFWSVDSDGCAHCPTCTGEVPREGYEHYVLYLSKDRTHSIETVLGPYSAAEAARTLTYLVQLDNIKAARVAVRPEWA
jgi:hypothetical protein